MRRSGFDPTQSYIHRARKILLLTREEEAELGGRSLAGDMEARHELVRRNLRLVIHFARKFHVRHPGHFEDLISEGNGGLFRATRDFDPAKSRFATHASSWIRQAMSRYGATKKYVVRVPEHMIDIRGKVNRRAPLNPLEASLWSRFGGFANRISFATITRKSSELMVAATPEDSPYGPDHEALVKLHLGRTSARNREILMARLLESRTLDSIGLQYGITKERVRQIELRFIAAVRASAVRKNLICPAGRMAS
jgi:RNA polymerase primary sigma factor